MKKALILSGPPGSGKSFTAHAMSKLFKGETYITWAKQVDKNLFLSKEKTAMKLIIIEECSIDDIHRINNEIYQMIPDYLQAMLPFVVYTTQENLEGYDKLTDIGEIILCKYQPTPKTEQKEDKTKLKIGPLSPAEEEQFAAKVLTYALETSLKASVEKRWTGVEPEVDEAAATKFITETYQKIIDARPPAVNTGGKMGAGSEKFKLSREDFAKLFNQYGI